MRLLVTATPPHVEFELPRTAPFLLSEWESSKWRVRDTNISPSDAEERDIDWNYPLPNGTNLLDPCNATLLETARQYAMALRVGPFARIDDASTHVLTVGNFLHVAGFMLLRGVRNFGQILKADVDALIQIVPFGIEAILNVRERVAQVLSNDPGAAQRSAADIAAAAFIPPFLLSDPLVEEVASGSVPPESILTVQSVHRLLRPLEDLYIMRGLLGGDVIPFQPYPQGAARVAAAIGKESKQTPTIPHRIAHVFVEGCIRWILYVGPTLADIIERERHTVAEGRTENWRNRLYISLPSGLVQPNEEILSVWAEVAPAGMVTIDKAVRLLACACLVVICALTSRRLKEVKSALANCIKGTREHGLWIELLIEKSLRERRRMPCPETVELAVDLLRRISDPARQGAADALIFQWKPIFRLAGGRVYHLRPEGEINYLARLIGVPKDKHGKDWHFTARQFRRLYAILWTYRWQHPDLEALAQQMGALSITSVYRYISDPEAKLDLEEARVEFTGTILYEAIEGHRDAGGPFISRVKRAYERWRRRVASKITVILPEKIESWVRTFVDRAHIVLKSNRWSYCACPETAAGAARANCRKGSVLPESNSAVVGADLERARPEVCRNCIFNGTDRVFVPYLKQELAEDEAWLKANEGKPTLLREVKLRRVVTLREYLKDIED